MKKLCDGEKHDNFAPVNSCYDDGVGNEVKQFIKSNCHGQFECTISIPTLIITGCDGLRRELKTEHICGKL